MVLVQPNPLRLRARFYINKPHCQSTIAERSLDCSDQDTDPMIHAFPRRFTILLISLASRAMGRESDGPVSQAQRLAASSAGRWATLPSARFSKARLLSARWLVVRRRANRNGFHG